MLAQVADDKFSITGSVTFSSALALAADGRRKFKGLKTVEVDLAGVTKMDSAILAVLLSWRRFCKANDAEFCLSGCKDDIKVLLKSYHIADLFDI